MDVMAVANQLRRHIVIGEDSADEAGIAMRCGPHPIEQMCGVARAGGKRFLRLIERRARMADRHMNARCNKRAQQRHSAVDLGRHRDDADVGTMSIDRGDDLASGK